MGEAGGPTKVMWRLQKRFSLAARHRFFWQDKRNGVERQGKPTTTSQRNGAHVESARTNKGGTPGEGSPLDPLLRLIEHKGVPPAAAGGQRLCLWTPPPLKRWTKLSNALRAAGSLAPSAVKRRALAFYILHKLARAQLECKGYSPDGLEIGSLRPVLDHRQMRPGNACKAAQDLLRQPPLLPQLAYCLPYRPVVKLQDAPSFLADTISLREMERKYVYDSRHFFRHMLIYGHAHVGRCG